MYFHCPHAVWQREEPNIELILLSFLIASSVSAKAREHASSSSTWEKRGAFVSTARAAAAAACVFFRVWSFHTTLEWDLFFLTAAAQPPQTGDRRGLSHSTLAIEGGVEKREREMKRRRNVRPPSPFASE